MNPPCWTRQAEAGGSARVCQVPLEPFHRVLDDVALPGKGSEGVVGAGDSGLLDPGRLSKESRHAEARRACSVPCD